MGQLLVENAEVKTPSGFYEERVKHEYSEVLRARAREVLQNAIDAGATLISVVSDQEARTFTISDNGSGMSFDILVDKLFALGGSYKDNENATGAFGIAKEVIFFANPRYTIHTGNLFVEGRENVYNISEIDENFNGTKIELELSKDADFEWQLTCFTEVAQRIETSAQIKVNGKDVLCRFPKGNFLKEIEGLGDLYSYDSKDSSDWSKHVAVRINGIWMHDWYIGDSLRDAETRLTLELTEQSLDCLTTNRDNLKYNYRGKADRFIERLMIDRKSTLRPDKVEVVATVPGDNEAEGNLYGVEAFLNDLKTSPELLQGMIRIAKNNGLDPRLTTARVSSGFDKQRDYWEKESYLKFVGYKSSFLTKCEKHELADMRSFLTTKKARTIATIWTETIKQVLLDNGYHEKRFSTGFTTGEDPASFNVRKESTRVTRNDSGGFETEGNIDNHNVFLLHPYILMKKYGLSDRKTLGRKLKQMAVHEVAHIRENYHHEGFTANREGVEENTWKSDRIYDKISKLRM